MTYKMYNYVKISIMTKRKISELHGGKNKKTCSISWIDHENNKISP